MSKPVVHGLSGIASYRNPLHRAFFRSSSRCTGSDDGSTFLSLSCPTAVAIWTSSPRWRDLVRWACLYCRGNRHLLLAKPISTDDPQVHQPLNAAKSLPRPHLQAAAPYRKIDVVTLSIILLLLLRIAEEFEIIRVSAAKAIAALLHT